MKQGLFTLNHLINNIYSVHAIRQAIAKNFDISLTQYGILLELTKSGGSSTPHALAAHLGVSPSAITLCLNQLEPAAYVLRQPLEEDRRKIQVELTASAGQLLPQIDLIVAKTISDIWQPLTKKQRELLLRGALSVVKQRRGLRRHSGKVRADTLYAEAVIITYVALSAIAKEHGLILAEFSILYALAKSHQAMRSVDVANMLLMRQNWLTVAVKPLVRKGYVKVAGDESDGRVRLLAITGLGNEQFFSAYRPMSEVTKLRVGVLSAQELAEFKAIGDIFIEAERHRRALT